MTYEEALSIITDTLKDRKPISVGEDEDGYYFGFKTVDDPSREYSAVDEYSVNKKTGKVSQSDIVLFYAIAYPDKIEKIKNSFRKI